MRLPIKVLIKDNTQELSMWHPLNRNVIEGDCVIRVIRDLFSGAGEYDVVGLFDVQG